MKNNRSLAITILTTVMLVSFLIFPASTSFGRLSLNDMMTPDEQKKTGVDNLNATQRKSLESWLDQHFEVKEGVIKQKQQLSLSLNIDSGAKLELTDGAVYEIDPADRLYSSLWITPFHVHLSESGDAEYPVRITNLQTGTSVNGKSIEKEAILEPKK